MKTPALKTISPIVLGTIICISINIILILLLLLLKNNIPPQVPLYYGMPQGEEQLAPMSALIIPPLIAISVCLINVILTQVLKDSFLQKTMLGVMIVVTTLAVITVTKIILLVGTF